MATEEVTVAERKRRKMHALSNEIGFDREERMYFAEFVLHEDVTTWRFTEAQIDRMLDALVGVLCAIELARQRTYSS